MADGTIVPVNIAAASLILTAAWRSGVRDLCLCAGSRNSPLIAVAATDRGFRKLAFPDERAAAFFALGRAKTTGRPAAVITTSGTAVAELLPAVIEAHYSGVPILIITADRPRRYRGTGAPQSIEQNGIFGPYCGISIDIEAGEAFELSGWNQRGPLHLNIAFDEPLIDAAIPQIARADESDELRDEDTSANPEVVQNFLDRYRQPLVIAGHLVRSDREAAVEFLVALGAPVYAEPLSGLRESRALQHLLVTAGERMLSRGAFDSVLRIGGVPTLRFWRDLEASHSHLPVLSLSALPFAGLSRGTALVGSLRHTLACVSPPRRSMSSFIEEDREMAGRFERILRESPASEPGMVHALSELIPFGSRVFLGNSLPIREWDLAATRSERELDCIANRGANGIDGAISTFLGTATSGMENWALIGDLTLLYDLSAPWILPQLENEIMLRMVVINNRGGRIFGRVVALDSIEPSNREKFFENGHDISFEGWSAMWKLPHERWDAVPSSPALAPRCVIEVSPDPAATALLWKRFDELWRSA